MNVDFQNLERLCQKMQARYGAMDPMVLQLLEELAARRLQSPEATHWTSNYQRSTAFRPQSDNQGR